MTNVLLSKRKRLLLASATSTSTPLAEPAPKRLKKKPTPKRPKKKPPQKKGELVPPLEQPSLEIVVLPPRQQQHRLEEDVWLQEQSLQKLLDRLASFSKQEEETRVQQKDLLRNQTELNTRIQTLTEAKTKHERLQTEVKESLIKSRERLQRLLSVIEEEANGVSSAAHSTTTSSRVGQSGETSQPSSTCPVSTEDQGQTSSLPDPQQKQQPSPVSNGPLLPLVNVQTREGILNFVRQFSAPQGLLGCLLPGMTPEQVFHITIMAIREANMKDYPCAQNGECPTRRRLLRETCLDFCLLAPPRVPKIKPTLPQWTLDIAICPYELAGTCVDEWCPYWHTTRTHNILARERLPLPSFIERQQKTIEAGSTDKAVREDATTAKPSNTMKSSSLEGTKLSKTVLVEEDTEPVEGQNSDLDDDGIMMLPSDEDILMLPNVTSEKGGKETTNMNAGLIAQNNAQASRVDFWWNEALGEQCNKDPVPLFQLLSAKPGMSIEVEGQLSPNLLPKRWGSIVDVYIMLVHSGRHDMIQTLQGRLASQQHQGSKEDDKHRLYQLFQRLGSYRDTLGPVQNASSNTKDTTDRSHLPIFCRQFVDQLSLALLGVTERFLHDGHDAIIDGHKRSIRIQTMSCIKKLSQNATPAHNSSGETHLKQIQQLLNLDHWSPWESSAENLLAALQNLNRIFELVNHSLQIGGDPSIDDLNEAEETLLKPCWLMLSQHSSVHMKPEESAVFSEVRALKLVAVLGSVVLGCLRQFAVFVRNKKKIDSVASALGEVDSTAFRMLKSTSRICRKVISTSDIVFTPLFAAVVATSIFLRKYSQAHHRLTELLFVDPSTSRNSKFPFITAYSDLLWSMLSQLRMSLPLTALKTGKPKTIEVEAFGPDFRSMEEIAALSGRLSLLGVRLHYVSIPQDTWASRVLQDKDISNTESGLGHEDTTLISRGAVYQTQVLEMTEAASSSLVATSDNDKLVPPSENKCVLIPSKAHSTIRSFPPLLMLVGKSLTTLHLQFFDGMCLPPSFGLYFPHLETLKILDCKLKSLPGSVRLLRTLKHLSLSGNSLTTLPCESLLPSLLTLRADNNMLTWFPVKSLIENDLCLNLELLDLSENNLPAMTISAMEVTQLSTKLTKLHTLALEPQKVLLQLTENPGMPKKTTTKPSSQQKKKTKATKKETSSSPKQTATSGTSPQTQSAPKKKKKKKKGNQTNNSNANISLAPSTTKPLP